MRFGDRIATACFAIADARWKPHRRLHPNKNLNEWLTDVFCAYPLFVTTAAYRASHFAHHRHTNTDGDPDWVPRQGLTEWQFPKGRLELAALFLRQLSGLNVGAMLGKAIRFGRDRSRSAPGISSQGTRSTVRVCFYVSLLGGLTYLGIWKEFLIYWFLPIITTLAFLMRVRSISEHFGLTLSDELTQLQKRSSIPIGAAALWSAQTSTCTWTTISIRVCPFTTCSSFTTSFARMRCTEPPQRRIDPISCGQVVHSSTTWYEPEVVDSARCRDPPRTAVFAERERREVLLIQVRGPSEAHAGR